MFTYVPQLIAALPSKTKTKFSLYTLPNGTVVHEHSVTFDGVQGSQTVTYESSVLPTDNGIARFVTPRALANEYNKAAVIENRAAAREATVHERRERLRFALLTTTGFEDSEDPGLWNKAYAEYYGWGESGKPKPEQQAHFVEYAVYYPIPEPTQPKAPEVKPAAPSSLYSPVIRQMGSPHSLRYFQHHCFPAGTPVLTIDGPQAIESLKPGDRVLSQDMISGELDYKTVTKRTLRPA